MTELVRLISEAYNGVEFEFIQKTELGMDPLYWYTKDGKIINNVNKWKLFDFCFTDLKITNKTGLTLRNFYAHPSTHSDLLLFASPAFKPDPLAPYFTTRDRLDMDKPVFHKGISSRPKRRNTHKGAGYRYWRRVCT